MGIIPVISDILEIILSNPVFTYIFIIFLLSADTGLSGIVNFGGILGWIVSSALFFISGINIQITTFNILVLWVILPIFWFALDKSRK
jgi:hypothetical protein